MHKLLVARVEYEQQPSMRLKKLTLSLLPLHPTMLQVVLLRLRQRLSSLLLLKPLLIMGLFVSILSPPIFGQVTDFISILETSTYAASTSASVGTLVQTVTIRTHLFTQSATLTILNNASLTTITNSGTSTSADPLASSNSTSTCQYATTIYATPQALSTLTVFSTLPASSITTLTVASVTQTRKF